ncbi:hypothetical protein L0P88_20010 [Muricauda sp. SCSIO 64092]|uniref:hypothetical protein n=1 Tax=Allomuricauda sp. SCSIO 64092 TaxID=2908842 RepID=UPI001FF5EE45|nr:hypothetical protein [Muricauda sp. SCSIO 64092]UOY06197.1 hypothetical protein L0P88_20010 [Muricauda sp. SCSIO 64092]
MKKSVVFIVGLMGLSVIGCFSGNDDYGYYPWIIISDAFTFENKENYQVGDTIIFNLSFSRYLDEDGYNNKLDIYETSNSKAFSYYPDFRKLSAFSDSFEGVYIREGLLYSPNGTINVAKLNTGTNTYESRMGIILVEEGEYSLSFNAVNLNSNTPYYSENIEVNITNLSENTPEAYYFKVEE